MTTPAVTVTMAEGAPLARRRDVLVIAGESATYAAILAALDAALRAHGAISEDVPLMAADALVDDGGGT